MNKTGNHKKEYFRFGRSFRGIIKIGESGFGVDKKVYPEAVGNSSADVYVVMLGSNDAKKGRWNPYDFYNDYFELCVTLKNQTQKPDVYLLGPPPFYP